MFTDASKYAWGAHVHGAHLSTNPLGDTRHSRDLATYLARGTFNAEEQGTGSTMRELLAVVAAVRSVKQQIKNTCVRLHTDNIGVVHILEKGFASTEALRTKL